MDGANGLINGPADRGQMTLSSDSSGDRRQAETDETGDATDCSAHNGAVNHPSLYSHITQLVLRTHSHIPHRQ